MNHCMEARTSLGVYVLGAIEPTERSRLESHLESCPACRDELAGMAGLPALLGRVDEAQLTQVAGPPPELLDELLARAAERRRGWLGPLGRWVGGRGPVWAPVAAAACLLLVIGALAGGLFINSVGNNEAGRPTPTNTPSTSAPLEPPATGPGERISAQNRQTNVQGVAFLQKKMWGTEMQVYVEGVPKGSHCKLRAVSRDGQKDPLGSWYVPSNRGYGRYNASTMFLRGQLSSLEVTDLDGHSILKIPT